MGGQFRVQQNWGRRNMEKKKKAFPLIVAIA
jgi:hypothetical protein